MQLKKQSPSHPHWEEDDIIEDDVADSGGEHEAIENHDVEVHEYDADSDETDTLNGMKSIHQYSLTYSLKPHPIANYCHDIISACTRHCSAIRTCNSLHDLARVYMVYISKGNLR